MTDGFDSSNNINELRQRAEDRLENLIESLPVTTDPETKRLVHELQVHQIELEMQNEELRRLQSDAETALEKYSDLYNSAPVAYFTLDRTGTISQVNLAGARLLNKPISSLVKECLAFFIPIDNRSSFNAYLFRIFESHTRESFKTDIVTEAGDKRYVQMDAVISKDDEKCCIAITDFTESRVLEQSTQENEENLKSLFNAIYESVCLIERDGIVLSVNQTFAARINKSISDCIGQSIYSLIPADIAAARKLIIDEVIDTAQPVEFEDERQGRWLHHSVSPILNPDGRVDRLAIYAMDITRRKKAEIRRLVSADMLKLINATVDFRQMIKSVVAYLQNWTGCEAVGIRIHEGDDYPYYGTRGFTDEFVQLETRLCQYDENNEIVRDAVGNPCLDCMCGNVLQGRFDPGKPFFTSRGSFWTNSTSDLLASTSDADRQARTRNRCNGEGYESVALISLRSGGKTTGLIQFNDKRKDRFTPDMIGILERLGESIASAILERQAREAQRLSEERYRTVVASTNDGIILQDRSGFILTFNKAAERIFGITAESALKQTSTSYDWKTYREDGIEWPGSEHPSMHTFSTGEPCHNALMKVVRSGGDFSWVNVNTNPIFTEGDSEPSAVVITISDITERKLAEESLQENERILNATQRLSKAGGWEWDAGTQRMTWTDEAYRIHDFDPDEFTPNSPEHITRSLACYMPDDQPLIRATFQRCIEFGESYDLEVPFITAKGRRLWIRTTAEAVWVNGQVAKVVGNIMDITDRKIAEEALRENEERFRTLASLAPVGIYLCDPDGSCKYANLRWCEMAGLSMKEALGNGWINGLHPEDRSSVISAWQQMVESEGHWGLEYRFQNPAGQVTWVYGLAAPQRDAQGNIIGYIGINTDITEQKLAEVALKANEEKLRILFDTMSEGVALNEIIYDDNGEMIDYRILEVNEAFYSIADYESGQVIGNVATQLYGMTTEYIKSFWKSHRNNNEVVQTEMVSPINGRYYYVSTSPFVNKRFVTSFFDITDRKHAEEELQESQDHYRSLAEDMPVYISSFLPDGTLTYVNNTLAAVTGMPAEDLIGLSFFGMCDPDEMILLKARLQSLTPENPTETHEQTNVDEDGSMKCLLWTNRAFFDESGRTVRFQAIGQDITESRRTEQALKLSEEKFSKAFHLSPDAVNINRLSDGCYIDINQGFTDIMGYTREEIIGRSSLPGDVGLWVNVEDRNRLLEGLRNTSEVVGLEAQFRKKDGSIITGLMSARIIEIDGEQCIISISRDITDRKRMEEELREAAMRQQAAVQAGNIGLWDWDLVTNKVTYSPEWKRQIGYEPDEIGDDFEEWQRRVHPDDIGPITNQVNTYIAEARHYYQIEFRFRHKDGSYRWISAQGSVIINDTRYPIRVIGAHVDITERRKAEEALRDSEFKLSEAQRVAHIGSWELDILTHALSWSDETYRVFGFEKEEFGCTMEAFFECVHPDDRPMMNALTQASWYEGKPFDGEHRIIRPDGIIRMVHEMAEVTFDDAGQPVRMIGTIQDITERKEVEKALQESESRLRDIIFSVGDWVWEVDKNGVYTYSSQKGIDLFGRTSDDIVGMTPFSFMPPEEIKRIAPIFSEILSNKAPIKDLENWNITKNGEKVCLLTNGVPILDEDGNLVGYRGVDKDITERKLTEQALRESEEKFAKVFHDSPVLITISDITDGTYLDVNECALQVSGFTRDEVIGHTSVEIGLLTAEHRKLLMQEIQSKGHISGFELDFHAKDGRVMRGLFNGELITIGDRPCLLTVTIDMTERKQAEEALASSQAELKAVYDHAPVMMCVVDEERRVLYANQPFIDFTGTSEDELRSEVACGVFGCINAMDDPKGCGFGKDCQDCALRLAIEDTIKTGTAHHNIEQKATWMCGNERRIVTLLGFTTLIQSTGQKRALLCIQDITERKKAELALKESEERVQKKLNSILSPDEDLGSLELEDIIDVAAIQRLMDEFYLLTKVPNAIIDLKGKVLVGTGWQDICTQFHRMHPETLINCLECDTVLNKDVQPGTFKTYLCKNNLWDCCTPLMVGGQHVGNLFTGQFFFEGEKPDDSVFLDQAAKYGFDEEEYMAAIRRVPIWDRETIEVAFEFYVTLASMITSLSHGNISLARILEERKRAEQALRESEDRHRSVVENTPDVIMRFDRQHRHVFANTAVKNVTPFTAEDFIGKTHREMDFPEEMCQYWDDVLDSVFRTGIPYETEFSADTGKGSVVFNWRLIPEKGLSGEIESILSVSRDITDYRKVEQNYRMLFQEMLDGFAVHEIICDESGNPVDYRFLAVNPAFEQMTGLNATDAVGRTVKELMPGTEQHWIDIYGKVALSGEPIFFDNYSSELHKHFEVTAFRPAPNQFACIFVDITERLHIEQEKRRFYRDTIKSVTQGKLDLVSFEDVQEYLDPAGFISSVASPVDSAIARRKAMEFCRFGGLDDNGIGLFESAVGEAMTNAIKHADGCKVYAGVNGNTIWVAVSDTGKGISTMLLPGATLRKGYSSKISMGMGYTIMMEATDNIMLCTGTEGTTVVLSVNASSSMPALSLDDFPDTWDEISGG